jgi:hypothetical protein
MHKDPDHSRTPFAGKRRGARTRELDANELANVLGGTDKPRPDLEVERRRGATPPTRGGGFWRWLLG